MKPLFVVVLAAGCLTLAACDPVTLGLVTAGGGMAVNHQMSATITRTFSENSDQVHTALLSALDHMSIQVTHSERRGEVEFIQAVAGKRAISLQVEPVTRTTTLIEVAVHQDLLTLDGATGREIVAQTEQALSRQPFASAADPANAARFGKLPASNTSADSATGRSTYTSADGATGRTTYYGYDTPAPTTVAKAARPKSRNGSGPASGTGASTGTGATSGTAASTGTGAASATGSTAVAVAGARAAASPPQMAAAATP